MNNMIDIIGSSAIGLYFVYMILSFNLKMNDAINISAQNNIALWESINLGQLADYDFNKIGYRADSVYVFAKAEPGEISFFGDIDNDGFVDTVQYILIDSTYRDSHAYYFQGNGNPADLTASEDDIPLYRIVNGSVNSADKTVSLVTRFEVTYNDSAGNPITTPLTSYLQRKRIKGVTVNFTTTSPSPVIGEFDTTYQIVEWEKKFTPKNIN